MKLKQVFIITLLAAFTCGAPMAQDVCVGQSDMELGNQHFCPPGACFKESGGGAGTCEPAATELTATKTGTAQAAEPVLAPAAEPVAPPPTAPARAYDPGTVPASTEASQNNVGGWIVFLIILVVIIGYCNSNKCPSCKEWFVKESLGSQRLSSRTEYRMKTHTIVHRNNRGEQTGTSEQPTQVAVDVSTYQNYYKCSKCNHTWSTIASVES